jgi:CubicO group peptidase (beta-lactamase class C family)
LSGINTFSYINTQKLNETSFHHPGLLYLFSCSLRAPLSKPITDEYYNIQLSWGLGVGLFKTPYGNAFFHTGHNEGWQNYFEAYPEKKTAIIFMSNSSNFEHATDKLLQVTIKDALVAVEVAGVLLKELKRS